MKEVLVLETGDGNWIWRWRWRWGGDVNFNKLSGACSLAGGGPQILKYQGGGPHHQLREPSYHTASRSVGRWPQRQNIASDRLQLWNFLIERYRTVNMLLVQPVCLVGGTDRVSWLPDVDQTFP